MEGKYSLITEKIIGAFYVVYNALGCGFLEKVYENALCIELKNRGICFTQQHPIKVYYLNQEVGIYCADLFVEETIIVELKAAENLCAAHEAQLLNYLRATEIECGLLLNFGKTPQIKRKLWNKEKGPENPVF